MYDSIHFLHYLHGRRKPQPHTNHLPKIDMASFIKKFLRTNTDINKETALASKIGHQLKECKVPRENRKFLPESRLDKIFTKENVKQELERGVRTSKGDMKRIDLLTSFIVPDARKIFATVLFGNFQGKGLHDLIEDFLLCDIRDKDLPITQDTEKNGRLIKDWASWGPVGHSTFLEKQWLFLAPVLPPKLDPGEQILKIQPETILPFTDIHPTDGPTKGAFGEVFQVSVCEGHIADKSLEVRSHISFPIENNHFEDMANRKLPWRAELPNCR